MRRFEMVVIRLSNSRGMLLKTVFIAHSARTTSLGVGLEGAFLEDSVSSQTKEARSCSRTPRTTVVGACSSSPLCSLACAPGTQDV